MPLCFIAPPTTPCPSSGLTSHGYNKGMRIIGDVHGRISDYMALANDAQESIQIGDMGLGFRGVSLPPSPDHKFFRGNHDSPQACRAHPNYIGDWGHDAEKGIFWLSGADSIDKHLRREGVSWWRDEELSVAQFQEALDIYERAKPRVVLSHDGPQAFIEAGFGIRDRSRTRQALQAAYELWQPDVWIHGHHHLRREFESPEGTLFVCLPELGFVDLELPLPPGGAGEMGRWRTEVTASREFHDLCLVMQAAVQGVVEMPDRRANLLARLCLQNSGRLSKNKRDKFRELTDEEVALVEEAVRPASQDAEAALREL
jgi:predicted phosphodiesterase